MLPWKLKLLQNCQKLSKEGCSNFVPSFPKKKFDRKLPKGGYEFVQACDSCRMPGFYAGIIPG